MPTGVIFKGGLVCNSKTNHVSADGTQYDYSGTNAYYARVDWSNAQVIAAGRLDRGAISAGSAVRVGRRRGSRRSLTSSLPRCSAASGHIHAGNEVAELAVEPLVVFPERHVTDAVVPRRLGCPTDLEDVLGH